MEHISLPSFDIASGDSNEEFIHGDPVDPLGESQYDGNYDTIGVHSSWKTSSEELEANNINTKDDYNTLLVENDIEVKPRIEDLQNSIKKEEQTWNRDFLESVLYDVKNVKIEKFEPDVCHNLISYSNYPENEERIICKQESTPTTTFESTNPELEEASFSTRESVVERNGSNDNHNSSKTETKKQKCNVYQDPSSSKTTISDKPKQSDTIDNLDDSSTDNGWEEPSDDFAENNDHTPPGTPIDKPIMVADDSKITGGSKDSKITEICSNDNDDEDISKRNSSEMLRYEVNEKCQYHEEYLHTPNENNTSKYTEISVMVDNNKIGTANIVKNKNKFRVKKNTTKVKHVNINSDRTKLKSSEMEKKLLSSFHYVSQFQKYICKICNRALKEKNRMKHLMTHSEVKEHACMKCCRAFKYADSLKYHNDTFHSSEEYKCPDCLKVFRSHLSLKIHINHVHTKRRVPTKKICDLCQKELSCQSTLSQHIRTQHIFEDSQYICNECSAVYKVKGLLIMHMINKHLPPERKCPKCPKLFATNSKLQTHLFNQHMEEKKKKFVCDVCGKAFSNKHNLVQHTIIHTDQKPYFCEECGKCFRTITNLGQHSLTHSDKRPFSCDLCNKSFKIRNHLRQHMAVHGMVSTSTKANKKR